MAMFPASTTTHSCPARVRRALALGAAGRRSSARSASKVSGPSALSSAHSIIGSLKPELKASARRAS
jgi:hypothetical protein